MRFLILAMLSGALAGCGIIYHSTSVTPGVSAQGRVRVVAVTPETVIMANRTAQAPRALPAYFSQTAGVQGSLSAPIATPEAALDRVTRQTPVETRLPPPVNADSYRIGVGDVVLLATPKSGTTVEQLTGILAAQTARQGYTVQDDGAISIPTVGRLQIAGQTIEEAEATLFPRLLAKNIDPTFSLEIADFKSQRVAVGGDVASPKVVPITLSPLYLNEALAAAGGVATADSDYAVVRLYRDGKLYQVPLRDLYDRPGAMRIQLTSGDSVFVDSAYQMGRASAYFEEQIKLASFQQTERQARLSALEAEVSLHRANLQEARENFLARIELGAEPRDFAYITGEVGKQSRYALPFGRSASLADALYDTAQGIPVARSNPKEIYVLRGSPNPPDLEEITAWHIDARNAAALVLATRFQLQPNDVIFVASQPVTLWSNVVNALTPTLILTTVTAAGN